MDFTDFTDQIVTAVGGAVMANFINLISSNVKARKNIREMRTLIRQQRAEIEHLREENSYLRRDFYAGDHGENNLGHGGEPSHDEGGIKRIDIRT